MKTKVSIVIQSHLSDALIENEALAYWDNVDNRIKFVKYLIHHYGKNLEQEINPDSAYKRFLRQHKEIRKETFYPEHTTLTRARITELINSELEIVLGVPPISPDHKKLTNKLCQEIADAWFDEGGSLWRDEDALSEEWAKRIKKLFSNPKK